MGLLDGWVRYWFHGELLPLPADLQRTVDALQRALNDEREGRLTAEHRAHRAEQELARLRDQVACLLQPPPSS